MIEAIKSLTGTQFGTDFQNTPKIVVAIDKRSVWGPA